jgi:hypothetical protein
VGAGDFLEAFIRNDAEEGSFAVLFGVEVDGCFFGRRAIQEDISVIDPEPKWLAGGQDADSSSDSQRENDQLFHL